MPPMPNRASIDIAVRGYEMDPTGRLSAGSLARILEHARWETLRTDALGIAAHFQRGVVRAQCLTLDAPMAFPDVLRVRTWIARVGRTSFDFAQEVRKGEDEALVARNVTTAVHLGPEGPAPLDEAVRAAVVPEGRLDVAAPPGALGEVRYEHALVPRWSDQDVFQHVNQATYLDWLEDARAASAGALPHPRERALAALRIQYDDEARAGERLRLRVGVLADEALGFELVGEADRVLTRARVELQKDR